MTARARIVLLVAVGVLATVLDSAPALLALSTVCGAALARVHSPWRRPLLLGLASVTASTMVSQGLFWPMAPRTPLASLGGVVVWQEGVRHGAVQSLRFVATALAGSALALSTAPDRIAAGLVALGVPGGAAFLATTALRFVPDALSEWTAVRRARGERVLVPALRLDRRLAHELAVLRPVAVRAVRRAATLAESLESRGFDPASPPVVHDGVTGPRDVAALAVAGVVVAAVVVSKAVFFAWTRGLVTDPALRPWMALVRAWG